MAYTWTKIRYGPGSQQWAEWGEPSGHTPGVTADLPVLIYVGGGVITGTNVTPPARAQWDGTRTDAIYDGSEPIFSATTSGLDTQEDMVIFSINTARNSYNYRSSASLSAWDVGHGTYNVDDTVKGTSGNHVDHIYRCIAQHTATSTLEPHVGAGDWDHYWSFTPTNDIGTQYNTDFGSSGSPGYAAEGVIDVMQAVQYVRQNQSTYGITDKVAVFGEGGGGQLAACAAYSRTLGVQDLQSVSSAGRWTRRYSSVPNAVLISDAPTDFRNYTLASRHYTVFGSIDGTGVEWNALPDEVKAALSPVGVLESTRLLVPTYCTYRATRHDDGTTPYTTSNPYDHADNGWDLLTFAETMTGYNVVHVEDSDIGGQLRRYTSTSSLTSITDSDTALATDITDWIDGALA